MTGHSIRERPTWHRALSLAAAVAWAFPLAGQEKPKPPPESARQPKIHAVSEEVVLDIIVRDKHGRPVRDLKPDEIQVFEEGARQDVTSFRLVEAGDLSPSGASAAGSEAVKSPAASLDPLRQVHLVTLVFERLNEDGRRLSREAARQLLSTELRPNVYVAVFTIDQRLNVLQPFTADQALLLQAVDLATSGTYSQFTSLSEKIERRLEVAQNSERVAEQAGQALEAGRGTLGNAVTAYVRATADRMTLNMLQNSHALSRMQQGRSSIFSLLSMVTYQRSLPGRKTLIYFSEGLQVPSSLEELFQTTISAANRSNVSVYAVDARGLVTGSQMDTTRDTLSAAARASQQQMRTGGRLVTPEMAGAFDTARDSIRANVQGALATLSESTGGFLVADTNDLRRPMERITEDLETYYELSYVPRSGQYDGRFRRISVKVLRPAVKLQTRSGYFALPSTEGAPLLPYEMPLLAALDTAPLPRAFDYHAAALRFERRQSRIQYELAIEVPLKGLDFQVDKQKGLYRAHLSVLAIIKNSQGQVVEKFSQDQPLEGPLSQVEDVRVANFILNRHMLLPPGRYTLDTAALDRNKMKVSARRAALMVMPSTEGVAMSSLAVIRSVEAQAPEDSDAEDPLRFQGGRIVPSLGEAIQRGTYSGVSFYFVIYPSSTSGVKPQLLLEFYRDGQPVGRATPDLPAPDDKGRIAYVASSTADLFTPGQYEVRALVRQGASAAEEHALFTIRP